MLKFSRPLLEGEADPGTGTPPPPPTPTAPPVPPADPGIPPAPPVAKVVVTATKTEEEQRLMRENAELARLIKERETENATIKDEFHRYKQTVETPKPPPAPKKKSWQDGIGWNSAE